MTDQLPILYSFRRCPYAMRARLAIAQAGIPVVLREVQLRRKPAAMLTASPKGTVPVLVLPDAEVIDESLDIMLWALRLRDPANWLAPWQNPDNQALIQRNDGQFKYFLDRYKYADRYPEHSQLYYRQQGEGFLRELEHRLQNNAYLSGTGFSIADAAIAPFIRQYVAVDKTWFDAADYPLLRQWLQGFLDSALFHDIMQTYQPWTGNTDDVIFGNTASNCSN